MDGKGEGGGSFPHLFPFLSLAAFLRRDGQRIWRKWEEPLAAHLRFSQECCCAEMFFFSSLSLSPPFFFHLAFSPSGWRAAWKGSRSLLVERNVRKARARGLSVCLCSVGVGGRAGGRVCLCVRTGACVCAFLRSDSRIPWAQRRQSRRMREQTGSF